MKKIRTAVIGVGHMGRYHAEKFAACEGAELAAVVDSDAGRAAALAEKLGCAAIADYRQLVGQVDAAVIATPTAHHYEIALACIGAGMHVLIEKPITRTVAEADALIAAAKRRGVVLQVGHVERQNIAFRALAARMDRPLFIDAERLSGFKQRGTDVDVVLDLMIHDIDLALGLAPREGGAGHAREASSPRCPPARPWGRPRARGGWRRSRWRTRCAHSRCRCPASARESRSR